MLTIFISYKADLTMWARLLQICYLIQVLLCVLGTKLRQPDSGLNSIPYVGSTITQADFSKNLIKDVRVFHLSDAINLEVSISRPSELVENTHAYTRIHAISMGQSRIAH